MKVLYGGARSRPNESRVVVTNAIRLDGINGPGLTVVDGGTRPTNAQSALRLLSVFVTSKASLLLR